MGSSKNENNENGKMNILDILLNKKTYLILSKILIIIPFITFILDLTCYPYVKNIGYDIFMICSFSLMLSWFTFHLVLLILNISSNRREKNTRGLVKTQLVFAWINILIVIPYNMLSQEIVASLICTSISAIIYLIMIIGYILKLVKRKY